MKETAQVINFGCRLNGWESEVIKEHVRDKDDIVVVNSCAVTSEAERQARQTIRHVHRDHPNKNIVVTGCAAQLAPKKWHELPGVTRIVGNEEKLLKKSWTREALEKPYSVSDIQTSSAPIPYVINSFQTRTRACVQVQQGCDHKCTFCIIPQARGVSRSVEPQKVIEQVAQLVDNGHREVVLTGVDVASWGGDLPGKPVLGHLCRMILKRVSKLERLRLSSIDPVGIDEEIWSLLETEKRFMPYLHLSLQSGCDMILKRMRRRHSTSDVARLINRARTINPDIGLGADIITGFPTENDTYFQESFDFLRTQRIPFLHVFPYSERPGTPADRMPGVVDVRERRRRAKILRELGADIRREYQEYFIGRPINVLVEGKGRGHSREFSPVQIYGKDVQAGTIVDVVPNKIDGGHLVAQG